MTPSSLCWFPAAMQTHESPTDPTLTFPQTSLLDPWLVLGWPKSSCWGSIGQEVSTKGFPDRKAITMSIPREVQDPGTRPVADEKGISIFHLGAGILQLWLGRRPLLKPHPTHGGSGEPGTIPEVAVLRLRKKKLDNFLLFCWVYLII